MEQIFDSVVRQKLEPESYMCTLVRLLVSRLLKTGIKGPDSSTRTQLSECGWTVPQAFTG